MACSSGVKGSFRFEKVDMTGHGRRLGPFEEIDKERSLLVDGTNSLQFASARQATRSRSTAASRPSKSAVPMAVVKSRKNAS